MTLPFKVKLDENLGIRGAQTLRAAGIDVATVASEDLCSVSDASLIEVCRAEDRVIITLDRGFSSILRFPPKRYSGIIVLRLPEPLKSEAIDQAMQRILQDAEGKMLDGALWIVDPARIRKYVSPDLSAD